MSENYHWSSQKDKGHLWQMKLIVFFVKVLPPCFLRLLAIPVGFFYFIFADVQRTAIKKYLSKIYPDKKSSVLKVFLAFSITVIEKVESWAGKIAASKMCYNSDDITNFKDDFHRGNGIFVICSHLGNIELIRALADSGELDSSKQPEVTAIVDFSVTSNFNQMLKSINPDSTLNLINADEIGPQTIIQLQKCMENGGLVVIAGDRSSKNLLTKNPRLPFLGEKAEFPVGPFYIAALLGVVPYYIFALRKKTLGLDAVYEIHVKKSDVTPAEGRHQRKENSIFMAEEFSSLLEKYCKKYPYQWYNFYDFWEKRHE